jgi:translation initiation factor 4A
MNVKCYVCIGGRNVRRDVQELLKGIHVVVGTSGRVHEMIKKGALKQDKIKILCVDEADDMLSPRSKAEITKGRSPFVRIPRC